MAMKKLMVAAMACAVACVARAATVVVVDANNSPYELGATGHDSKNASSSIFDLRDGAVLKWVPTSVATDRPNQWCSIVATNGAATILFDDAFTGYSIKYNFIARGEGSVTIRSSKVTSFTFGHDASGSAPSSNFAQYDFSKVSFVKDDGTPCVGKLTMNNPAAMATLQTQENVTLAFEAGKSLALLGENMFPGQDEVVFGTDGLPVNVYALNPKAFSKGQTVNLATAWRTLFLKPCKVPDFATENSLVWTTMVATNEFNVKMGHADAEIRNVSWYDTWLKGTVSGVGILHGKKASDDAPGSRLTILGDCSGFTGPITLESAMKMTLNTSSLTGKVTLNGGNTQLAFLAPAEGGPSEVAVADLQSDGSANGNRMVRAAANQTVKLAHYTGYPCLAGEDASAKIDLAYLPSAGTTIPTDGLVTITVNGQPLTDYVSTACGNAIFTPSVTGSCTVESGSEFLDDTSAPPTYVAHGNVGKLTGLPAGVQLTRAEGASVTVVANPDAVIGNATDDGVVTVAGDGFDWVKKAVAWFDPNTVTEDLYYPTTEGGTTYNTVTENKETCYSVLGLPNLVVPKTVRLWNGRCCSLGYYQNLPQCYPYVATSQAPKAGLKYLSFGSYGATQARRLQFVDWTSGVTLKNAFNHYVTLSSAKFAVLVFGSHLGGGSCILSTGSSKYFQRSGTTKDDPMMNVDANVWVNGAAVDPTQTGFSGGWDVISIDLTGADAVGALGADGNYQELGGGKFYGEMIFFSEVLTDDQRVQVEEYVAKKWALDGKYEGHRTPVVPEARLGGRGTVEIAAGEKVKLSGAFAGTIDLKEGASATVVAEKTAYTEEEVGALGPTFWIDPEAEECLVSRGSSVPLEIRQIKQHDKRESADIVLSSLNGNRSPALNETAFGYGPVRKWIDYNGAYETATSQGNTLRMRTVGNPDGGSDQKVNTCTGFIVQNSVRGGGTPFMDAVSGGTMIKVRKTNNYKTAMYASGTTDNLKKGKVYLNDAEADYTKGFTGGPEVFTFETKTGTTAPVSYFAFYENSENGVRQGEIQGEILLFDKTLTDAERSKLNAYLMKKWLGYMPAGYADLTAATVAGSGALTVPNLATAPKFAADYTGTVTVPDASAVSMTLVRGATAADDRVEGAFIAPAATLSLPAAVTVNVASAVRPRPGRYTLIEAGSVGTTTFALAADSALKTWYPEASVQVSDGKVELVLPAKGLMLMIR